MREEIVMKTKKTHNVALTPRQVAPADLFALDMTVHR